MASATFGSGGGTLKPVDHLDSPFNDSGRLYGNHFRHTDISRTNSGTVIISSTAAKIKKIVIRVMNNNVDDSISQVKLFTGSNITTTGASNIFCTIPINSENNNGIFTCEFEVDIPAGTELKLHADYNEGGTLGMTTPNTETLLIFDFLG